MTAATENTQPDLSTASDDDLKAMGLPPRFTLDDLKRFMTEEEIEADMASDDPLTDRAAGDSKPPATAPADDDPSDDDPDGDDDPAAASGDDDPAAQAAPATPPAAATPAAAPETQTPDPRITPQDVTEHQKVIDTYKDERAKIRAEYNNGDMTDAEFDEKMDTLSDQLADAKAAIKDAARDLEAQKQDYASAWYRKAGAFMDARPEFRDATPVPALGNESPQQLFDRACRYVNGEPAFQHLSFDQRLAQAAQVAGDYYAQKTGQALVPTKPAKKADDAPKPKPTPEEAAKAKVQEQGQRPAPVQTLGGLTAASETDVENSRFAAVDNATGLDAERAFSRLSPAEQEAYLAGA
jgi:hypothetical protein